MDWLRGVWNASTRKKTLEEDILASPLRRCLGTVDLTMIGIGHMVGSAMYVVSGTIIRDLAGPAAIVSSLLAGFCALLAALCYAEFGAKIPKAGSAYTYTYFCMGEAVAFVVGWNTILENMIMAAAVSKAWSLALDGATSHVLQVPCITEEVCPDLTAVVAILMVSIIVAIGIRSSTNVNNVLASINLCCLSSIIIASFVMGKFENLVPERGGFAPYGFTGIMAGCATSLFSYVGFEAMSVAAEETKAPNKSLPRATFLAVGIVSIVYLLATMGLACLQPYYLIDPETPYVSAFQNKQPWLIYFVTAGTIIGASCTMLGGMFNLSRSVYAVAADGLLFKSLADINKHTQTPIIAIVIFGSLTALLACFMSMGELIEFLSAGTLSNFFLVAACVLILRYEEISNVRLPLIIENEIELKSKSANDESANNDDIKKEITIPADDIGNLKPEFRSLEKYCCSNAPLCAIYGLALSVIVLALSLDLLEYSDIIWMPLVPSAIACVICVFILLMHVKNIYFKDYQMPGVPVLPFLSMLFDALLIFQLKPVAIIRLALWVILGLVIYLLYGVHHSMEIPAEEREAKTSHTNLVDSSKQTDYGSKAENEQQIQTKSKQRS